jgi:HAD superfamily hydrolase (TIGR01509 family)
VNGMTLGMKAERAMTSPGDGKLLIFDCDGTLVDSELLCNIALECCLARAGIVEHAESLLTRYRGSRLSSILSEICSLHRCSLPGDFVEGYRDEVAALFERELKATDGVADVLAQLGNAKCVASSGPISKIRHALALTHLSHFFDERLYSSYVIQSWKPDPAIYLHAASTEGFRPEDCIVIEDSLLGIQAAQRAGMAFLLYDPEEQVAPICPAGGLCFSKMIELPGLIQQLSDRPFPTYESRPLPTIEAEGHLSGV